MRSCLAGRTSEARLDRDLGQRSVLPVPGAGRGDGGRAPRHVAAGAGGRAAGRPRAERLGQDHHAAGSPARRRRTSSGSVSVGGVELVGADGIRVAELRRHVLGLVDQHSGRTLRPELDVLGNVALQLRLAGSPKSSAQDAAREALETLGLSDLAERRPSTLSAGEAQRVAVCAAIAHWPSVLLADEPTGELDVGSADAV